MILGVLSAVVGVPGLCFTIYFGCQGASRKQLDQVQEQVSTTSGRVEELRRQLLERMSDVVETRDRELRSRYPLGYFIFAVSGSRLVVPEASSLVTDFEIKWDPRGMDMTPTQVTVHVPYIRHIASNAVVSGTTFKAPRQPGFRFQYFDMGALAFAATFEILEDSVAGIIAVIGLTPGSHYGEPLTD